MPVPGQLLENTFESQYFRTTELNVAGTAETIITLPNRVAAYGIARQIYADHGIDKTLYVGWGKQAPAQSQNERDAWAEINADIAVHIGMKENSGSYASAAEAGFEGEDVGPLLDMIPGHQFVKLLIGDGPLTKRFFSEIQDRLDPGAIVGLSHGFLIGAFDALTRQGEELEFRDDITVVGMFPKGLGGKVRELRQMAAAGHEGAGVNASIAAYLDRTPNGTAMDLAAAWGATGGGAPGLFKTTMENEYRSDIFGERAILLGGIYGISVALYTHFYENANTNLPDYQRKITAFRMSAETITGPLSQAISDVGLDGVAKMFDGDARVEFNKALAASYGPMKELMGKIYRSVKSGREIQKVIEESAILDNAKLPRIGDTEMWAKVGKAVAAERKAGAPMTQIDPTTAGIYIGAMKAQADLLLENGHAPTEIGNETIIEAINSLNIVMAESGIDALMDGCSETAAMGARDWGPQFASTVSERVIPRLGQPGFTDDEGIVLTEFEEGVVHDIFHKTAALRPPGTLKVR